MEHETTSAGSESLLRRVRALTRGHVESRRSIAQLLLSEGSGLARLSMSEVAQLSYTSKPSLVRFAQALDYNGWLDFQDAFVRDALLAEGKESEDGVDPNFPFEADTPSGQLAKRVLALKGSALEQVLLTVDHGALQEAANRIVSARQVVYFAVEQNRFFGENFSYRLHQLGIECLVPPLDECMLVARGMGPDTCAVIVSYSGLGEHRPPSLYLPTLQQNGVPCVAVTNSGDNWLRHNCDCVLAFPPEERLYSKISGYYSEEATTFVLDLLFSLCFQANYEKNVRHKLDAVVNNERVMQASNVIPR